MSINREQIKFWAREAGFDMVGVAAIRAVDNPEYFYDYVSRGYHGEMAYMIRNLDKRIDAGKLVVGAKSIICVGLCYGEGQLADVANSGGVAKWSEGQAGSWGFVSRFAWGRDYHIVMKERLGRLRDKIIRETGGRVRGRCFVDTAPLAEKFYAARAGLGWVGKNTLLINRELGSFFVLGELIVDAELECDVPVADGCGNCRKCLEACPTGALRDAYLLDARRCIAYLTVESKQAIPQELRGRVAPWLFGCDVCQEVCPYNRQRSSGVVNRRGVNIDELLDMDEGVFGRYFAGSGLMRTGLRRLQEIVREAYCH